FGCRKSLETLVRNRLAAFDREAVGAGGEPGLGALDGGELLAQTVRQAFVELVLVKIGAEVSRVDVVGLLARIHVGEPAQRPLDSLAFLGQQLSCPLRIHHATLSLTGCSRAAWSSIVDPARERTA